MGMSSIYSKISGEIDRGNLEALPQVLWNHFYSWGTNFVVFVGRLIHEIKNPTNNETWESVWHRYSHAALEWPRLSGPAA
jgi:hypothetical protein